MNPDAFCPYCGRPDGLYETRGHYDCRLCRRTVESCCEGAPANTIQADSRNECHRPQSDVSERIRPDGCTIHPESGNERCRTNVSRTDTPGESILRGARQALAYARGEGPGAVVHEPPLDELQRLGQEFVADQEPLGAEFEAVWDANADRLYEPSDGYKAPLTPEETTDVLLEERER